MKVTGAKEMEAKLRTMGKKAGNAYLKEALREAAKPVLSTMKSYAPKKSGVLERAIRIRAGRSGKGKVSVLVGPGRKFFTGKAYYAGFVNFGHFIGRRLAGKFSSKAKYHEASVKAGKKFVPGKHFVERAYDASKGAAEGIAVKKLGELIQRDA